MQLRYFYCEYVLEQALEIVRLDEEKISFFYNFVKICVRIVIYLKVGLVPVFIFFNGDPVFEVGI